MFDIICRISQPQQSTMHSGSCHRRLGSEKPPLDIALPSLAHAPAHDLSPMLNVKPVVPVRFYPRIESRHEITI